MRPRSLAIALALVGLAAPARAMFGLNVAGQNLFFVNPVLSEQNGDLEPHLDANSPDFEFEQFEGSSLGAAYGAAIFTAGDEVKGRWDRYRVRAGLLPGAMRLLGKSLRFGFGLRAGAEIQFLRHFEDAPSAAKATPLEPWVLRSADSILEGLRPGDMASLPIQGEFLLQPFLRTPLMGIPARASIFMKLGGEFQLSLLRLRGTRVRLRVLSSRSKTFGAAFKAGLFWELELLEILGQDVSFLTELNVLKTAWKRRYGDGVLLDATLDLADPAAREAFELFFYRPLSFVGRSKKLLSVGWSKIQELARRDTGKEPPEQRVTLHRCGLLGFRQQAWFLKLGNMMAQWGRKELATQLQFDPYKTGDPTIHLAANMSVGKTTFWFRRVGKWFAESHAFASETPEGMEVGLWTFRYRVKDRRFSPRDLRDLRRRLRFQVGPEVAPTLESMPEGDPERGKADIRVRFSGRALRELAEFSEEELTRRWEGWMEEIAPGFLWRQGHAFSMMELPGELHALLQRAVHAPDKKVLKDLANFREKNRAFGEIGPSFLLHLLDLQEEDPRASAYLRYKSYASGENVRWKHGRLAARPSEAVLPILRFLETGVIELQHEAVAEVLEARASEEG
jgi:hypothetical protein